METESAAAAAAAAFTASSQLKEAVLGRWPRELSPRGQASEREMSPGPSAGQASGLRFGLWCPHLWLWGPLLCSTVYCNRCEW